MKSFKQYSMEDAPVNSTGAAVDMNPNGGKKGSILFKRMFDRRSRYAEKNLFKRANDK